MAKFTAGVDLNIKWANHSFIGATGTTHRVTDALVEEFTAEVAPQIPGFAWVTQDELTAIATLPIGQTDVTGLTAALAGKYDKTGGTISGSATVTGTLSAGATTTGALVVQGAASVTGTLSAGAATTGPLQVDGAIVGTSTLVVTSGITAASLSATGTVRAGNNLNVTNTVTATDLSLTGKLGFLGVMQAGGTAFPGSPANNDVFYRTDLDLWFFYNGTRWLSVNKFVHDFGSTSPAASLSATTNNLGFTEISAADFGGSDLFIETVSAYFFVNSGSSALSGSHSWQMDVEKAVDQSTTFTNIASLLLNSGVNGSRRVTSAVNALLNNGTTHVGMRANLVKVGTPGAVFTGVTVTFRVVAT